MALLLVSLLDAGTFNRKIGGLPDGIAPTFVLLEVTR